MCSHEFQHATLEEVEAAITEAELVHIGNGIALEIARDAYTAAWKVSKASRQKLFALISLKHRIQDEAMATRANSILNYVRSLDSSDTDLSD